MSVAYVVTTIQEPTASIRLIATEAARHGSYFVVVGDRKSPKEWHCPGATFYGIDSQMGLPFRSSKVIPEDSYARKMIGYLLAYSSGPEWITETDDDNSPTKDFFDQKPTISLVRVPVSHEGWVNPYPYFSDRHTWPRGFPLRLVGQSLTSPVFAENIPDSPGPRILQALADGDPDVDAVYRLTSSDLSPVIFNNCTPLIVPKGAWAPFNSQATTWHVSLLPLMYLPTTCTFRMTDIWRSFVVQRLLPSIDGALIFTSPTVHQERNEHDLIRDFEDEIPGYLGNERIRQVLEATEIRGGLGFALDDILTLYSALVNAGFLHISEISTLEAWISDVQGLLRDR